MNFRIYMILDYQTKNEVYKETLDLISSYRNLEELRVLILKLEKAREKYEDECRNLFNEYLSKTSENKIRTLRLDNKSIICYEKETIEHSCLDEELKKLARSHIEKFGLPVILFKLEDIPKPYLIIPKLNKSMYRKCERIYQKLRKVSNEIREIRSRIKTIEERTNWEKSELLIHEIREELKKLEDEHQLITWLNKEVKETIDIHSRRYEKRREEMKSIVEDLMKRGMSLDTATRWYDENPMMVDSILKDIGLEDGIFNKNILKLMPVGKNQELLIEASQNLSKKLYDLERKEEMMKSLVKELSRINQKKLSS